MMKSYFPKTTKSLNEDIRLTVCISSPIRKCSVHPKRRRRRMKRRRRKRIWISQQQNSTETLTPSPFLLDIVDTIEETERLQPWLFKDTSQNNNNDKNTTESLDKMKHQQNKMNRRLVKEHHQRARSEKREDVDAERASSSLQAS